jgi:adenylate kinase
MSRAESVHVAVVAKDDDKVAVILLGMPGAGKGTQAQLMAEAGWSHINVGGLVRAEVDVGTAWGKHAQAIMMRGELLPSSEIEALIIRQLRSIPMPIVVEGYPRRLSEVYTLPRLFGQATFLLPVLLEITQSDAISRLADRMICSACGWVTTSSSGRACSRCGDPLISRDDDRTDHVVRRRMQLFETETVPLIEHFCRTGRLATVPSDGSREMIHDALKKCIGERCPSVLKRTSSLPGGNTCDRCG